MQAETMLRPVIDRTAPQPTADAGWDQLIRKSLALTIRGDLRRATVPPAPRPVTLPFMRDPAA